MKEYKVPIQSLIDHIKTAVDVDPWAKEMTEELLKEQEERKGNYVPCKVKTPTGKWNGEKCSVCGTEYIGSAPHQWKFCPDCGAKMEGRERDA